MSRPTSISATLLLSCMILFISGIQAQRCRVEFDFERLEYSGTAAYRGGIVYVPVIFNILYTKEEENLSDNQIFSQLEALNEDFSAASTDWRQLPESWKSRSGDANIRFCLYRGDEFPQGIRRRQVPADQDPNLLSAYYEDFGGIAAFQPAQVLNIWIMKLEDGLAGYTNAAHLSPMAERGIVLDYRYTGRMGSALQNAPFHLGRTLTHEVGHFFGLQHVWGLFSEECEEDDGIADTPIQKNAIYHCPENKKGCFEDANVNNFMNLVDDPCMCMFTRGQLDYMQAYIQTYLPEMSANTPCEKQVLPYEQAANDHLSVFPNPNHGLFTLQNSKMEDIRFELFDSRGRLYLSGNSSEFFTLLDARGLTSGLYALKLEGRRVLKTVKIIIQ